MPDKEKIVLIDGHSILNRAFYGLPMLTNSEGLHTNAVYGFLNILFKVLESEKADYAAVAFDRKEPTFRHKMFDAYKGTRKPMPQELHEQVPLMKEMLEAMRIPVMELPGYEADDILGTVSSQMAQKGLEVCIVSGDRDLLQLAREDVRILIPKTKATGTQIEEYYDRDVLERYQVTPVQFIDVKALMGDTSDNIPGVPGIGEKTATKLIVQYGSIEEAYAHVDEITPARAREALREHYDLARMSKVLATIDLQVPFELSQDAARIGQLYTKEALELCRRLEFKNLLGRFQIEETEKKADVSCCLIRDFTQAEQVFEQAQGKDTAFFLVEDRGSVLGAALCFAPGEAYFIEPEGFLTQQYLCGRIADLTKGEGRLVTLHLKEQLAFVPFEPAHRRKVFDTAIAAYLLNPLKDGYDEADIAREYLDQIVASRSELFGKDALSRARAEKEEAFLAYIGCAADILRRAFPVMEDRLMQTGMKELFDEIEMPLVYTLYDMEREGIRVQAEELKRYGEELGKKILELEQKIYEQAGEVFNINSPKQLGVILFEKLELPHGKKTKTGYSTAADVLDKLAPEYPVVSDILEYRQMTKLKSTYADGLANFIQADGRIHGKFHQTITATGRISSTEPNLQNIPIRMELGRLIRKVFVPDDGFVFLDADYSQIELRVLAHLSDDDKLIQAYQDAQDIHTITASQVFHVAPEDVTPLLRRNAKAVNFGIVYGISSFGLSQDLSITRKEAQEYIAQYFKTYPGIKRFLDTAVEDAKKNGYVTTMFGRRRPVPELQSSNFMQRSFGERVAMNAPIQGTAADIIKIAMNRVNECLRSRHMRSRLILQVHDELLVETAKEELEEVRQIMVREMQQAASMKVRLEVDIHDGRNWYEAK
ncbi:DNA polymerase I [Parablautia sp. Marseille-Q6255]|uniref:DNA polymerase I n=1 Tax=Parablautia sp. Marseille-Q6255 TaxID=3039593 RepID=UPI0024BC8150|nr:DNA polymerase I [Parablautia sp. Marseille-Q6255]